MELKNLNDFYEKQEYISYDQAKAPKSNLERRMSELSFFLNITVFSMMLVIVTYLFVSAMTAYIAVPLSLVLSTVLYLLCKSGIKKLLPIIMNYL